MPAYLTLSFALFIYESASAAGAQVMRFGPLLCQPRPEVLVCAWRISIHSFPCSPGLGDCMVLLLLYKGHIPPRLPNAFPFPPCLSLRVANEAPFHISQDISIWNLLTILVTKTLNAEFRYLPKSPSPYNLMKVKVSDTCLPCEGRNHLPKTP